MGSALRIRTPAQAEMPFAVVQGAAVTELPNDLYIPPNALEIFIEAFEGPLDLLLYLIRRRNFDILDIPIAEITRQYVEYVELMREMRFELAGDYLVMAATLAEIKSRLLLPRLPAEEAEEPDPRADLVRRLQEYERYRLAAESLDDLPREGRDFFVAGVDVAGIEPWRPGPRISVRDLVTAFAELMERATLFASHQVMMEPLPVRERMTLVLGRLESGGHVEFTSLLVASEGRRGVVVTLLALLELMRERLVELVQITPFAPIHVRGR